MMSCKMEREKPEAKFPIMKTVIAAHSVTLRPKMLKVDQCDV